MKRLTRQERYDRTAIAIICAIMVVAATIIHHFTGTNLNLYYITFTVIAALVSIALTVWFWNLWSVINGPN